MTFELDPEYKQKRTKALEGGSIFPAQKVLEDESSPVEKLNSLFGTKRLLGSLLEESEGEVARDLQKSREEVKRELTEIMSDFHERGIKIRRTR